jgi:hypothetical protein
VGSFIEKELIVLDKGSIVLVRKTGIEQAKAPVRIYGVVGRATACVCVDVGSIPCCGALKVWQWTLGSKTAWLVNKSAGQPPLKARQVCVAELKAKQVYHV